MEAAALTDLYINNGIEAIVVIAFFVLVFWVMKTSKQREERIVTENKEREEKLYTIIDALSEQLPEIRASLAKIETKIDR